MWQNLRNLLIVTGVTALIWFFAEAESLRTAEVRSVEVTFQSEPNSRFVIDLTQDVASVHGNTVRIDLLVDGPAAGLEPVERTLRQPITVSPGMDGVPAEPGRRAIDLLAVLSRHPDLRGRGVTFRSLSPEAVEAVVDELVTRSVKIEADVPDASLEGPPEVRTAAATITLPASQASKINDQSKVLARVDPMALGRLTPGRRQTLANVRLVPSPELAAIPHLKIEPDGADVVVRLRVRTTSVTLAGVPVQVRLAPAELGKWDIDIPESDRFLSEVTVTGPVDVLRQIQDKSLPLVATIALSIEDLERSIASKDATFGDLPTGLRFDAANRTVHLKITRRAPGPP